MNTFLYLQNFSESRDCFMKSIQNFSYFLSYVLRHNKKLENKAILIGDIILDSRRTISFFSFIDSIHSLRHNMKKTNSLTKKLNRNVHLSSLIETIFENIDFLIGKNIIKGNNDFFTRAYCALWAGNIGAIIMEKYNELKNINKDKDKEQKIKNKKKNLKLLEIGSYICDLPCAIGGTDILPLLIGTNFNNGIIGLTGLIAGTSRYYLSFLRNKKNMNI